MLRACSGVHHKKLPAFRELQCGVLDIAQVCAHKRVGAYECRVDNQRQFRT